MFGVPETYVSMGASMISRNNAAHQRQTITIMGFSEKHVLTCVQQKKGGRDCMKQGTS